jgi:dipeptidyl aminopeptidase/acylaminoacyl peptidase
MPVHRHLHAKRGSVYGSRAELDAWWASRALHLEGQPTAPAAEARDVAVVGRAQELLNDDLRSVAFSPDGALVLFWERTSAPADGLSAISVWAVPTMGGALRRYLPGGAEVDWSSDGTRVVYHPPAEGDPLFVTDSIDRPGRQIHVGSPGVHNHFPLWAPDDSYVYFVQGAPGVATDLWRVEPDGGRPERMTSHESRVSHPAFIERRTLLYLATLPDGSGPWLHALDVGRCSSRRVTAGVERYSTLAASADGRRLVLTTTRRKSGLWRTTAPAEEGQLSAASPSRFPRPTADRHASERGRCCS